MNRILIIGGSDAGISAGLRAKEIDPASDVTVLVKDEFPNFSICGLPFYIGGEVRDWPDLAHRGKDQLTAAGLQVLVNHEAMRIHPETRCVSVRTASGSLAEFPYDRLIIATGAVSARPPIAGSELPGVFFMRFMDDGFRVSRYLDEKQPKRAAIIGTGYIGMEMAEALSRRGTAVTLLEMADAVMPSFDAEIGAGLQKTLEDRRIQVETGIKITEIQTAGESLKVRAGDKTILEADFILIAAGAKPCVELAVGAGIALGQTGAIAVNEKMETSARDIFAAGDCVETLHRLTGRYVYMPLGTTSHKQGRIAGENAAGGNAAFKGVVGTQSLKIFDRILARTGFRDAEARKQGLDPVTVDFETPDHKAYYPGASSIHIRLTGDRKTGRLLGAQIMGQHGAEISKRIDIIASALFSGLRVTDLADLDLSYTPPLSSPWDPLQMAAFKWCKFVNG